VKRVAVFHDPTAPVAMGAAQFKEIEKASREASDELRVTVDQVEVKNAFVVEQGTRPFAHETNSGLIITTSTFATRHRGLTISLAARKELSAIYMRRRRWLAIL
jgi:hypothetical protein